MNSEPLQPVGKEIFNNKSYLSFKLNDEYFALPVRRVLEIIEVPAITRIPQMPEFIIGVVNMRDLALPVIDARIKFGMRPIEFTVNTCIVVVHIELNNETITIGVLVDSVLEIFETEADKIQDSPLTSMKYDSDFLCGMITVKEKFMMLVDINKLFSETEMDFLTERAETENAIV